MSDLNDEEKKRLGEALLQHVAEKYPYEHIRERREKLRHDAGRLAAFTGAWGMLTGFAVFITVESQREHLHVLGLSLLCAVVVAFVIDWLREKAAGHGEAPMSWPKIISTILVLATFEMFALAVHTMGHKAAESELGHVAGAIFGTGAHSEAIRHLTRGQFNLVAFIIIWIVLGGVVAFVLGRAIDRLPPEGSGGFGHGLGAGLKAGFIAAPIVVFGGGLLIRLGWAGWVFAGTGYWPFTSDNVWQYVFPLVLLGWVASAFFGKKQFTVGSVLIAVVIGVHAIKVGLDLGALTDVVRSAFVVALQASLVWGVPAVVLGFFLPLLRRPSDFRWLWSPVALVVAGTCMAVVAVEKSLWVGVAGIILFAASFVFRRTERLEEFWPLLCACAAMTAFNIGVGVHHVTGLGIYQNLQTLINAPLAPRDASPELFKELRAAERESDAARRIAALTVLQQKVEGRTPDDAEREEEKRRETERALRPLFTIEPAEVTQARENKAQALRELHPDFAHYLASRLAFEYAMRGDEHHSRASFFELATMGSLTFWTVIGLLAAWQIRKKA